MSRMRLRKKNICDKNRKSLRKLAEFTGNGRGDDDLWHGVAFALVTSAEWDIVILDEAQSIKNPAARQTQAIKAIIGVGTSDFDGYTD